MGIRKLMDIEKEFGHSYTENLTINMGSSNPHLKEVLAMVGDRILSLSLRRQMRIN